MSWLPRLQIALFVILIVGMVFLILGHLGSGWSSLTYFAWGMVISVGVVLLNLILSTVTAILQPRQRKLSIWIAAVSIVMLVGLVILWRMA
jgi:flagellar biosynthesis protein FliR